MEASQRELISRRDAGFARLRRLTMVMGTASAAGVLLTGAIAGITIPGRAAPATSGTTISQPPPTSDPNAISTTDPGTNQGQTFQQPVQQPVFGGFGGGGFSSGSS